MFGLEGPIWRDGEADMTRAMRQANSTGSGRARGSRGNRLGFTWAALRVAGGQCPSLRKMKCQIQEKPSSG